MLKRLVEYHTTDWPTELKIKNNVANNTIALLSDIAGYVVAGSVDGDLTVYDADTMALIYRYKHHSLPIINMNLNSNSEKLITVGKDYLVSLWDLQKHEVVLSCNINFEPVAVSFNPEKWNSFIAASQTKIYRIEVDTELNIELLVDVKDQITSIQCLRNGMFCLGTNKKKLNFYDPEGNLLKSLPIKKTISGMAFTNQANILAACCNDHKVRVFYMEEFMPNLNKCKVSLTFENQDFETNFNECIFSKDGDYLYAASAFDDGTVCAWHTFAQAQACIIHEFGEPLKSMNFDATRVMLVGVGRITGMIYTFRNEPIREWDKALYKFTEILDPMFYHGTEEDWDAPDINAAIVQPEIDVWTTPEKEARIPFDM